MTVESKTLLWFYDGMELNRLREDTPSQFSSTIEKNYLAYVLTCHSLKEYVEIMFPFAT